MSEECKDEQRAAERAGDSYYRAVNAWATDGRRPDGRQKAFFLARAYHRSLEFVRRCLERLRHRPAAQRRLEHTAELQQLLEKDMKVLGQRPQTDET